MFFTKAHRALGLQPKDLWRTPDPILDRVRQLGPIGLDPCGNAQNTVGARLWYHPEHGNAAPTDATTWHALEDDEGVYQNHPYSQNDVWAAHAIAYYFFNRARGWNGHYVVLANASSGTKWFAALSEHANAVANLRKRMAFIDPKTGKQTAGNQWGTRVWYFGDNVAGFAKAFADIATIEVRYLKPGFTPPSGPATPTAAAFVKYDHAKNRVELVPPEAIEAMGAAFTYGAAKYSPDNWRKCDDPKRYQGATFRHYLALARGEAYDPESGLHHLCHLLASAAMWFGLIHPPIKEGDPVGDA